MVWIGLVIFLFWVDISNKLQKIIDLLGRK